jgi:hypothetical protein
MSAPAARRSCDHPLAEAADRAAKAAGARAQELAAQGVRLRQGGGTTIADVADAATYLDAARGRHNEARRRLVTAQLARAHKTVVGHEFLVAARRLARLTLAEDVRSEPLDP